MVERDIGHAILRNAVLAARDRQQLVAMDAHKPRNDIAVVQVQLVDGVACVDVDDVCLAVVCGNRRELNTGLCNVTGISQALVAVGRTDGPVVLVMPIAFDASLPVEIFVVVVRDRFTRRRRVAAQLGPLRDLGAERDRKCHRIGAGRGNRLGRGDRPGRNRRLAVARSGFCGNDGQRT